VNAEGERLRGWVWPGTTVDAEDEFLACMGKACGGRVLARASPANGEGLLSRARFGDNGSGIAHPAPWNGTVPAWGGAVLGFCHTEPTILTFPYIFS